MVAWPLINSMNPAADTLALSTIEFDLTKVQEGQQVVIKWQGKPVFVRYRTPAELQRVVSRGRRRQPGADRRRAHQGRSRAISGRHRLLHPPGLHPDLRHRRFRRLVLPLPRLALRRLGPYP